ncbi:hypothetical protein GOBAR_AA02656 [Gossypium barbadense]|uniref:U-box domain-containing protein n=1 Tax=Gossypium barbadense TaxID=3634 RepID=A0A2P5YQU0_GOSBA|nr:hypothetical protein GOBAR_AA02656 [Gossypium barbadense]
MEAAADNQSPSSSDVDVTPRGASSAVLRALQLIQYDDSDSKLQAAKEIRRLTKTSQRCRRLLAAAVIPLVSMLRVDSPQSHHESALLALLNLAVKDEKETVKMPVQAVYGGRAHTVLSILCIYSLSWHDNLYLGEKGISRNKMSIVEAGALDHVIRFLRSENINLQESATAALLTLSASISNKPIIGASGAIPLLVNILKHGTTQAKVDAVMALSNLSTYTDNLTVIIETDPVPSVVTLLKSSKRSSKTAEKCCSVIESMVGFDEGRTALAAEDGGILAVVEVLENGTRQAREHAVGALLTICEGDRCKYRELILKEGVIPGLLELTVQGTPKSQTKAQTLLRLLRETPYPRSEFQPDTLENIVCNIISQIDGDEQSSKAKKMLAEMVQVSMEQSLRHLQKRALVCTPTDL